MLSVNGNTTTYQYVDDFMFFEFNGIDSSQYNIFKINGGDDLTFHNSLNSSHEYVTPSYSNRTYYLGSKNGQKEFKWKCAGEGLTLPQIREALAWLEEGTVGTLRDDHMGTWCYDVVVDSVSDFSKWLQRDGTYIVEFDIGFKHVGSIFARSYYAAVTQQVNDTPVTVPEGGVVDFDPDTLEDYTPEELVAVNEYGIPEVVIVQDIDTNGDDIEGQYRIRIARVGDKGYSMKCKAQIRRDTQTEDQVVFKLIRPKNGDFFDTIVDYEYTHVHQHALAENCTLEYNSNTNLLLLNKGFIEDTDTITISPSKTLVINELKITHKDSPRVYEEGEAISNGMFTCLSKKRTGATDYTGAPSSTSYYAEIAFDGLVTSNREELTDANRYIGYYDEYILTCTYTNGSTTTGVYPTVEVTQYTIL